MRNLSKLYTLSSKEGLTWYNEAHNFAESVALKYGLPLPVVCAVISALSPANNWEGNKLDTIGLIKNKRFKCSTYGQNVTKAKRILLGELLPDNAFSLKTGAKTFNFYHNILNPLGSEHVTVDRHSYTVATGKPYVSLKGTKYQEIANHYHAHARRLGILASQLQAVLWVDYRIKPEIKFKEYTPF